MESDEEFFRDDIVEGKRVRALHRNDVKLQYDSDSSLSDYENPDNKENTDEKDNEDDMFASEDEKVEKKERKKVELLDMNEFEKALGVENTNYDGKERLDDQDEEENEDEDDQANNAYYINAEDGEPKARKKEPKLEQFNLREEAEEGVFDADGNYERKASTPIEEEAWMNTNGAETRKAKNAQKLRERNEQRIRRQKLENYRDSAENIRILVQFLQPAETPLEALARLAPKRKGKSISEEESERKDMVFDITEACDRLTNDNDIDDVYEKSREELMRLYSRETGQELEPRGIKRLREEETSQEWEFCWKGEDIVNGPYSGQQMAEWAEHYFNGDVMVRRVGDEEFVDVNEVTF